MKPEYKRLFDAIHDVVDNIEGPWHKARDAILLAADDRDKAAIAEFIAWFEDEFADEEEDEEC